MNTTQPAVLSSSRQLDIPYLQALLGTTLIGMEGRIVYVPEVDSTNTLAMNLARHGSEEGIVVLTDSQVAGKGRQGRRWIDRAGSNALSSTLLHPLFPPYFLVMLASVAVVEAIAASCGVVATIKWPNDVLIEDRKVAGILIETSTHPSGRLLAVVGIGVNVNGSISQYAESMAQSLPPASSANTALMVKATTLEEACGQPVSRELFLAHLLQQVEQMYLALQQEARASTFIPSVSRQVRERWCSQLSTLGRAVSIRQGDTLLSGVAEDVNEHGELLLRTHSGERISITWGDVG